MSTKTKSLPYFDEGYKVTGPYLNKKQGRRFVTITDKATGRKTQKTYAKFLVENYLKRALSKEETVDHIDRNKLNDMLDNLRIIDKYNHSIDDSLRSVKIKNKCPICNSVVMRTPREMRMHSKRNHAGPFCGSVCRGKYGALVSHTGKKFPSQKPCDTEFFYLKKLKTKGLPK